MQIYNRALALGDQRTIQLSPIADDALDTELQLEGLLSYDFGFIEALERTLKVGEAKS